MENAKYAVEVVSKESLSIKNSLLLILLAILFIDILLVAFKTKLKKLPKIERLLFVFVISFLLGVMSYLCYKALDFNNLPFKKGTVNEKYKYTLVRYEIPIEKINAPESEIILEINKRIKQNNKLGIVERFTVFENEGNKHLLAWMYIKKNKLFILDLQKYEELRKDK